MNKNSTAFGAPGIEPRWTSSAKTGIGTAYHTSSCVWFTISHGIVNEIYFPHVDSLNARDLQFLITDGESFCHEERRDLLHQTEYPEQNALLYRFTNSDREGGYRLVREIVVDPPSLEKFANDGGMLPEQLWDIDDLPGRNMKRGGPNGSAMPLCWSHAEYVTVVRSHKDGVSFDRIEPVYQRYVKARTGSKIDIWTFDHHPPRIAKGETLRIITEKAAKVQWSFDGWKTANDMETRDAGFDCWFGDLPSDQLQAGASIMFTFLWQEGWARFSGDDC